MKTKQDKFLDIMFIVFASIGFLAGLLISLSALFLLVCMCIDCFNHFTEVLYGGSLHH